MEPLDQSLETKVCLTGLTQAEMCTQVVAWGLPKYVGKQIANWIYRHRVSSFEEMRNLSKQTRARLAEVAYVGLSEPVMGQKSKDGTIKYLYKTKKGNFVETVYIPSGDRATLCVSCQVGCKMGCRFCMTGRQTWCESLSTSDILNQIFSLPEYDNLTNLVFMGQGEPFDNTDAILKALAILTSAEELGWSPRRITVSTVGILPGLKRFLDESECHIAISLHNPFPLERERIMPIQKAYSIYDVVQLLRQYDFCLQRPHNADASKQRRLSFEYIVFKGLNDSHMHAKELVRLLQGLDCRINLIGFHAIPDSEFVGASAQEMEAFRNYLTHHGVYTTIRASRGQDILAACGMLSTQEQQRQIRQADYPANS